MNDYPKPDPRPVFTGKQSRARAEGERAALKAWRRSQHKRARQEAQQQIREEG